jgi:hypothetical protein
VHETNSPKKNAESAGRRGRSIQVFRNCPIDFVVSLRELADFLGYASKRAFVIDLYPLSAMMLATAYRIGVFLRLKLASLRTVSCGILVFL